MTATAEEKEMSISTFYEVYESNCAHYTFCIKPTDETHIDH